jgi:hypothetical protein
MSYTFGIQGKKFTCLLHKWITHPFIDLLFYVLLKNYGDVTIAGVTKYFEPD